MSKRELIKKSDCDTDEIVKDEVRSGSSGVSEQVIETMFNVGIEKFDSLVDAAVRVHSEKVRAMEESEKRNMEMDAAAIRTYNNEIGAVINQVDLTKSETVKNYSNFANDAMERMNNTYDQNRKSARERTENEIRKGKSSFLNKIFNR